MTTGKESGNIATEQSEPSAACCRDKHNGSWRAVHWLLALILVAIGIFVATLDMPLASRDGMRAGDLGALFLLGLLTGVHCVGMCGGLVLIYREAARAKGLSPVRMHTAYATGKTVSYTLFGAVFGFLGGLVALSPGTRGAVGIVFGVCIVAVGLGMVWRSPVNGLLARISHGVSRRLPRVTHPFTLGMLNGAQLLCGPLQAVYLLAAGSADPLRGAAMLLAFALGTLPVMMAFAFFTDLVKPDKGRLLARATALIVVVFGVVTVNRGLALVGPGYDLAAMWARLAGERPASDLAAADTQVIAMTASGAGWSERRLVLRRGVPTRWVIQAEEVTHCNRTLIVPALGLTHQLVPGRNVIEFTPQETGVFTYSCWMGMMTGVLEVWAPDAPPTQHANAHPQLKQDP